MNRLILSELAETDLTDIWVFVAQDNVEAADRLLDQIHDKCRFLANSPKVGRQRPELATFVEMMEQAHDSARAILDIAYEVSVEPLGKLHRNSSGAPCHDWLLLPQLRHE